MDREIVIYVLLLVALTWLLYKLTVMMEPPGDKPAGGKPQHDVNTDASVLGVSRSRQKPIHQRLRK